MPSDKKLILITGVTRGLGRALALKFASLGHTVIGCGRDASQVAGMQDRLGSNHALEVLDVADWAGVCDWGERMLARFGPPDYLINNAALINRNAPLWEIPEEEFSQVIDVNLKGAANILRAFLPPMIEKRRGVVINLSSGAGRMGLADLTAYCATKWGIEGLTKSLASELPDTMAAIPLSPGVVNTDMLQSTFGPNAANCESPETWADRAAPYILSLGPKQSGESLSVP